MSGVIKLLNNYGEIVCHKQFKYPAQIEIFKEQWKKAYGKRYNEENIIVVNDALNGKSKYAKPKADYSKGVGGSSGRKIIAKPQADFIKHFSNNRQH